MVQSKDSESAIMASAAKEATRNAKEYLVSRMKQHLKVKFHRFCTRIQYTPDPPKACEYEIKEMMSKLKIFIRLGGEIQILRKFEVSSERPEYDFVRLYCKRNAFGVGPRSSPGPGTYFGGLALYLKDSVSKKKLFFLKGSFDKREGIEIGAEHLSVCYISGDGESIDIGYWVLAEREVYMKEKNLGYFSGDSSTDEDSARDSDDDYL